MPQSIKKKIANLWRKVEISVQVSNYSSQQKYKRKLKIVKKLHGCYPLTPIAFGHMQAEAVCEMGHMQGIFHLEGISPL